MGSQELLAKLLDIQKALERGDCVAAHAMVIEAEDCVMKMDRELIEINKEILGGSLRYKSSKSKTTVGGR